MKQLADTRVIQQMTVSEADALFRRYAVLKARIAAKASAKDKKIAEIEEKAAQETAEEKAEHDAIEKDLASYILAHPDRFKNPRMRVTDVGKYGMRESTKVEIQDEDGVAAFSDANDLSLYELKIAIDKKAVKAALENGYEVSGAKLVTGDLAGITVDTKIYDYLLKG